MIDFGYNYDLMLVDLKHQGLDGFGFIRSLNDKFNTSPIIVITSNENIQDIQNAYKLGAMGFIHKSANSNEILNAIRQVLEGEIYQAERAKMTEVNCPDNNLNGNSAEHFGISERQFSVLQLINSGLSNKEIARELDISESTVKSHVSRLIDSLAAHNRTACVTEALRLGLL